LRPHATPAGNPGIKRHTGPRRKWSNPARCFGSACIFASAAVHRDIYLEVLLSRAKMRHVMMPLSRVRRLLAGYPELLAVLAAAILGLSLRPPLAWAANHQGINILLAVLVFATAVTIEPAALRPLTSAWPRLLATLAAGITVLPALSWAVSQVVAAGSLRDGIMTIGLAPCEIASVATTAMAAGEAALSAGDTHRLHGDHGRRCRA
jgi:Sodium Bile acid symporter family